MARRESVAQDVGEVAVFSDLFKLVFSVDDRKRIKVFGLFQDPGETTDIYQRFGERADAVVRSVKWFEQQPNE